MHEAEPQTQEQNHHAVPLNHAEALTLFELLARWFDPQTELPAQFFDHEGEMLILLEVLAGLEEKLVEPFMADYLDRLERARETVKAQFVDPD
jgi:hypothetical protein